MTAKQAKPGEPINLTATMLAGIDFEAATATIRRAGPEFVERYALILLQIVTERDDFATTTMDPGLYRGNHVSPIRTHDLFDIATATPMQRYKALCKLDVWASNRNGGRKLAEMIEALEAKG